MKRVLGLLILILLLTACTPQGGLDVTGVWSGTATATQVLSGDFRLILQQSGNKITGEMDILVLGEYIDYSTVTGTLTNDQGVLNINVPGADVNLRLSGRFTQTSYRGTLLLPTLIGDLDIGTFDTTRQ